MVRNLDLDEILPSDANEMALLDDHGDRDNEEEMPKVLKNLSQILTSMFASMLSMEKSFKRIRRDDPSEAEEPVKKRRKSWTEHGKDAESDLSDGETLLKTTEPQVDTATEGETSVSDARHEYDALLTDLCQDFDQDEDIGPNINQQLADIIIKRWSAKLSEPKLKEKMENTIDQETATGTTGSC